MEITSATITAFYLFDVAEQIDLTRLRALIRGGETARLTSKSTAPSYLQYQIPPVVADGEMVGLSSIDGFRARVKFFDYGVVSLALTKPFAGSWQELVAISQKYIENDALEQRAEEAARQVLGRCAETMTRPHEKYLSEDYLALVVTDLETPTTAEQLVADRGQELAQLLRGERQPLSRQEQEEVLRNRLSYLADDLVIPTWNGAFIYDTEPGAAATLELCEFANSQLLEFRYYDDLLDTELGRIYATLQRSTWWNSLSGRGLHQGRQPAAFAVHRRQRDHRSHRERAEVRGRHLRRARVQPGGRPAGPRAVEAKRRGEARNARRHLPVRRRTGRDLARAVSRADDHPHPGPRAGAVLPRDHEVTIGR